MSEEFDPIALPAALLEAPASIAILAGHYCVSPELEEISNQGKAEELSFRSGLSLFKTLRTLGKNPKLFLWINDIGISRDVRDALKSDYRLPDNYLRAIKETGWSEDDFDIDVVFESSIRNKASTLVKKLYRRFPDAFEVLPATDTRLVRCVGDVCDATDSSQVYVYAIPGPDGNPLVVKEGPNPKCSMILASLFDRIANQLGDVYLVNIFNSIYVNRIRLGLHVHKSLFDKNLACTNVFCDDEQARYESASI